MPESMPGFAPHISGLIVPEDTARIRVAMTWDQYRQLSRTIKDVCAPFNIKFLWRCNQAGCPHPEIERIRHGDGGFILRCGHRDIVFSHKI